MSLSSQFRWSWALAWSRPMLRMPQRMPPWTSRSVSQPSRPGSRSEGRPGGKLQATVATTKEFRTASAAKKKRPKGGVKVYRLLSPELSEQQNTLASKGERPGPSPVNSPSWSRFDVARDPNRTPLPRRQELPRQHEQARGSANRLSGAVRGSGGEPLPDRSRGMAGVAPPRNARGTEEVTSGPFSSGIPARAPFRPLNSQADDVSQETQDGLASVHSGHSRFTPTPKPRAKTVRPDALHYEPTDYKDPVTSKYLVAKERFRPGAKKDWSKPQQLSPENWLPRNTLNPRLLTGSQEAPSTSAEYENAVYNSNLPGPDAASGSPAQMEAETRRDHPLEGKAPDGQVEAVSPPEEEKITQTPSSPRRKSPARARRDAIRRLELIERHRYYLCGKHGVDPDASQHGHEEKIQKALERFIQRYDRKARRRDERRTEKRSGKRKVKASVARKGAAHREEARRQAQRLANAILGPVHSSA